MTFGYFPSCFCRCGCSRRRVCDCSCVKACCHDYCVGCSSCFCCEVSVKQRAPARQRVFCFFCACFEFYSVLLILLGSKTINTTGSFNCFVRMFVCFVCDAVIPFRFVSFRFCFGSARDHDAPCGLHAAVRASSAASEPRGFDSVLGVHSRR